MDDPESVLELYQRAVAAAPGLWDIQLEVAKHVGLMDVDDDDDDCPEVGKY
jgi:hypothetical protein